MRRFRDLPVLKWALLFSLLAWSGIASAQTSIPAQWHRRSQGDLAPRCRSGLMTWQLTPAVATGATRLRNFYT